MGKTAAGAVWLKPGPLLALRVLAALAEHRGRRRGAVPCASSRSFRSTRPPGSRPSKGRRSTRRRRSSRPRRRLFATGARRRARRRRPRAGRSKEKQVRRRLGSHGDRPVVAPVGLPTIEIPRARLDGGVPVYDLMREAGLVRSNSEARRLIRGRRRAGQRQAGPRRDRHRRAGRTSPPRARSSSPPGASATPSCACPASGRRGSGPTPGNPILDRYGTVISIQSQKRRIRSARESERVGTHGTRR